MSPANGPLTLQLLEWVAARPRTYADAMDAWRSTCPRLTIWEDALADGLVRIERVADEPRRRIVLTSRGRELLDEASSRA